MVLLVTASASKGTGMDGAEYTKKAQMLFQSGQLHWENDLETWAANTNQTVEEFTQRLIDVQTILDEVSHEHNTSFSLGMVTSASGAIGAAGGINDHLTGERTTTSSRFPVGSVTKPFTCANIMQFHEKGMIDIDAPIFSWVDPVLERLNGTTMLKLWNGDAVSQTITARQLMGMRGGIHDYNDTWYYATTINDPQVDVTPFDLLHRLNKSWVCEPGTCGLYASTGFELLGLALVNLSGITGSWTELDQYNVLPPAIRGNYKGLGFPKEGPCTKDPDIVHQYTTYPYPKPISKASKGHHLPNVTQENITFYDLIHGSCLNGWTCGNIAITPMDIARFHSDLHNLKIVSQESLDQMTKLVPMTTGWSPQPYGLGLMLSFPHGGNEWAPDEHKVTTTIGHNGADYGSMSDLTGWNMKYNFSLALTSNSIGSLNCSKHYNSSISDIFFLSAVCPVYDAVLTLVTGGQAPRLNCSTCPNCPYVKPPQPPNPNCVPLLTKDCADSRSKREVCYECARDNGLLKLCNPTQVGTFCGFQPRSPTTQPSARVSCDWQI